MHIICHIILPASSASKILIPIFYQYFKNGGFTAFISCLPFSKIPSDQIIETTINLSTKSAGGYQEIWKMLGLVKNGCGLTI